MKVTNFETVKSRLDAGEKLNLLDVREPVEHFEYNIGGILLPLGKIQVMQIDDIDALREEEIIVYCRSGKRSANAALLLEEFGFKNVHNLEGGMLNWQEQTSK